MIGKAFYYYFIVVSLYVLIISHCLFLHTDDFIILFQCKIMNKPNLSCLKKT